MASNHKIAENLKKYFYSGVGLAAHSNELFKKVMDESVRAGRVSELDGKKIIYDVLKKIEERKSDLEDKYNEALHKFVSLSSGEVSSLQKKVEDLEKQLKAKGSKAVTKAVRTVSQSKSPAKAVAKKAVKAAKKVAKKAAKKVAPKKK